MSLNWVSSFQFFHVRVKSFDVKMSETHGLLFE